MFATVKKKKKKDFECKDLNRNLPWVLPSLDTSGSFETCQRHETGVQKHTSKAWSWKLKNLTIDCVQCRFIAFCLFINTNKTSRQVLFYWSLKLVTQIFSTTSWPSKEQQKKEVNSKVLHPCMALAPAIMLLPQQSVSAHFTSEHWTK